MENREEKIQISPLLEMIYEIYRQDIRKGVLRDDIFKDYEQAVGKSATEGKTFHQTALLLKE
jgi:hypothetical protein